MTHPILDTSSSRTTIEVAELLLVEKLPVLLPDATMWVGKAQMTTTQAVAVLKAHRDAKAATDAAKQLWQAAIRAEHALAAEAKQVVVGARAYAAATLGEHSLAFDELAFKAKAKTTPTAATQKATVEKRNATRVARRTMGKKQRAAIKGAPLPAAALAGAGLPSAGAVLSLAGAVLRMAGPVLPSAGAVLRTAGPVSPSAGAVLPTACAGLPSAAAASPSAGAVPASAEPAPR